MEEATLAPPPLPAISNDTGSRQSSHDGDDDDKADNQSAVTHTTHNPEESTVISLPSSVVPCQKPHCARYAVTSTKGDKQFCCKHIRSSGQNPKVFISCQYPDCSKLVQPTSNDIRVFCQHHLRQQNLKFTAPSCKHPQCKTKAMTDSSGQTQFCTKHMQAYGLEPRRNRNIKVCGHQGCSARAKQSVGGKAEYCATHMYQHGMLPKAWESRMDWLPQYGLEASMPNDQQASKRQRTSSGTPHLPPLALPPSSEGALSPSAYTNGTNPSGPNPPADATNGGPAMDPAAQRGTQETGASGGGMGNGANGVGAGGVGGGKEGDGIPGKTVMVGLSTKGGSMEEADELARRHQASAARLKELLEVERSLAAETSSCQLQTMELPSGPIYLLFYNNPDLLNVEGCTALAHFVRCTASSLEVGVVYVGSNCVLETRTAAEFALERDVQYEGFVVHDIAAGLLVVEVPIAA